MALGFLGRLFGFGNGRNAIVETVEAFRPNAEASAQRAHDGFVGAQGQFAAEFMGPERKGWFNSLIDGLNRLPRPLMAFGVIGLFAYALKDPLGFAERMAGLAAIPDQLWWIMSAVVMFYFGARELSHARNARMPSPEAMRDMVGNIEQIRTLRREQNPELVDGTALDGAPPAQSENAAIEAWRKGL